MSKKIVHVAVAVVLKNDEVLITKRQAGQHLEGFWEFPGGKVEEGEKIDEALIRELYEEVGLNIDAHTFLFDIHFDYPEKSVKLSIFSVRYFSGEAKGKEGQELMWCKLTDLKQFQFPPANQKIIEYLIN